MRMTAGGSYEISRTRVDEETSHGRTCRRPAEGLQDSFPCSDPKSVTTPLINGCPKKGSDRL